MKITSVSVRRLKTTHGYNNVAIEATSQVQDWEDPAGVREEVDLWVQAELEGKTPAQIQSECHELEWQVKSLQREHERLTRENERIKAEISRQPAETRPPLELEAPSDKPPQDPPF